MHDDFLYEHISDYNLFALKDFGVFHLNITQASKVITKILCLQGDIEDDLPEISDEENYSLYDESLDASLAKPIEKYKNLILSGIEKGTLKTEGLLRNPDESINLDATYLEMEKLSEWLEERSIDVRGDWYQQYASDEEKVAEAAVRAIEIKRYNIENPSNKKEELSPEEKITALKLKINELQNEKAQAWLSSYNKKQEKTPSKPLHTKEKETLLKLIIGMATGAYGYDPKALRSTTAQEISDDLAKKGISLDVDTVRKWLKQGVDVLPRDSEKI